MEEVIKEVVVSRQCAITARLVCHIDGMTVMFSVGLYTMGIQTGPLVYRGGKQSRESLFHYNNIAQLCG